MGLHNKLLSLLKKPALRQGGVVLFDQGFLSIANFVTGVLVARACSKEDYGIYVLAWSILLILISLQRSLVQVPFTVYIPKLSDYEKNTYQGSTLIHTGIISLLLFIILAIASFLITNSHVEYQSGSIQQLGLILASLVFPLLLREYIRSILFARLNFISSLIANSTGTLIQLSAISYLYINEQLNPTSAFLVILFCSAYSASLMVWAHRDKFQIKRTCIINDFKRSWKIAKWMVLNVLGMMSISQSYTWLLAILIDTKSVAIYGAALAVSNVMAPFLRAINSYALPRMSHGFKDNNIATLKRMLFLSSLVTLIPYAIWTIIASIFADEIMIFLYTKEYSGYATIVIILLLKSMIESVSTTLTLALQSLERPEITSQSLLVGAIITFSAGLYLIFNYQLIGAVISTLITTTVIIIYKYAWISHIIKLKQHINK